MKIRNKNILIVLMLFVSIIVEAQNKVDTISYSRLSLFTIASVDNYQYFYSDLNKSYLNSDIKMDEYRASVQIALPFKNGKTYFYNGWDYLKINSITRNVVEESYYNNCYEAVTCNLGFIQEFKKHWSVLCIVSPAIASDFKTSLSNDDFMLGLSAIAYKRFNRYFEYGLGFSFNTRFKYEMYLPLLSLKYKKDKHELSALLPLQINAFYCHEKLKIGFEGRLFENYFNADDDLSKNINLNAFGFSKVNFGPKLLLKVYHSLYFNMAGGITVFNELTSLDKKGNKAEIVAPDNKLFFNFGLKIFQ